jgi:hypothetical protein
VVLWVGYGWVQSGFLNCCIGGVMGGVYTVLSTFINGIMG